MKRNIKKPAYTKRTAIPRMHKGPEGQAVIECPFCTPTHPLNPSYPSACGTLLILTAEQTVIRSKYEKNIVCVKCKKSGGEMVMFQNAFIHKHDCAPGVVALTESPNFSKWAEKVAGLPQWARKPLERLTGRAQSVEEVMPDGTRTGVVLGYFFYKEVKNGKQTAINA